MAHLSRHHGPWGRRGRGDSGSHPSAALCRLVKRPDSSSPAGWQGAKCSPPRSAAPRIQGWGLLAGEETFGDRERGSCDPSKCLSGIWQSSAAGALQHGRGPGEVRQGHSVLVFKTKLCHRFCCLPHLSSEEKRLLPEISGASCCLKAAFADPTLKTQNVAAFGNMREEEKLSAGLKPLLAKDKRQSLSLSLSHTCTHRQTGRKALRGTINYSSYLCWAVRDSHWHGPFWSANPKVIYKTKSSAAVYLVYQYSPEQFVEQEEEDLYVMIRKHNEYFSLN